LQPVRRDTAPWSEPMLAALFKVWQFVR